MAAMTMAVAELPDDVDALKAMIVAMSRDICVALFDEIIALRPDWAGSKITKGAEHCAACHR